MTSSDASCKLFNSVRADTRFSNSTKKDQTSFSAACLGLSAGSGLTMTRSESGKVAACAGWSPAHTHTHTVSANHRKKCIDCATCVWQEDPRIVVHSGNRDARRHLKTECFGTLCHQQMRIDFLAVQEELLIYMI